MTDPVQRFMAHLDGDPVLRRRIELACDEVGFDAGHREVLRLAGEAGLGLTHDEAHEVLDRLAGM